MTGYTNYHPLFLTNLNKLDAINNAYNISSVLLTGKGEPLLNFDCILKLLDEFSYLPIELQTNGLLLNAENTEQLHLHGLNTAAISVDSGEDIFNLKEQFDLLNAFNLNIRLTYMLINDKIEPKYFLHNLIGICKDKNVKQLSFRKVSIPDEIAPNNLAEKTALWINETLPEKRFTKYEQELNSLIEKEGTPIRKLNFGPVIYDYQGIGVTIFPYCIQNSSGDDDIRSLIYQEDGHLYTSWGSKASILF
jgi:hypothetical protein